MLNSYLNENQAKHIANSLRMIGVGQFALYGLTELKSITTDTSALVISGCVYIALEGLAVYFLRGKNGKI